VEDVERCADIDICINYSIIIITDSKSEYKVKSEYKLVKVCDTKNVKLSLHDICLYMKHVLFLFELEQCVEYVYYKLSIHSVSEKFKYFVSILRKL